MKTRRLLLVDGVHGVYVPAAFLNEYSGYLMKRISKAAQRILMDPDHRHHCDVWDSVLNNHKIQINGTIYDLHQDMDLWAVPEGYNWEDVE